jgi:hypothetical protein
MMLLCCKHAIQLTLSHDDHLLSMISQRLRGLWRSGDFEGLTLLFIFYLRRRSMLDLMFWVFLLLWRHLGILDGNWIPELQWHVGFEMNGIRSPSGQSCFRAVGPARFDRGSIQRSCQTSSDVGLHSVLLDTLKGVCCECVTT